MPDSVTVPIILCGGTGSRLWPLSRESFPKQFLSLNFNEEKSLLQKTQERLKDIKNIENPILICNETHRFIAAEQMREINVTPNKILLEPFGRNTAPAITLAALLAMEDYSNPNLMVLSADHQIKNNENFVEAIKKGISYSEDNNLVTFGIVPTSPHTGYGYIQGKEPFDEKEIKGTKIVKFIEKPNFKEACKLIKNKCYTWNSGIFLFKAKQILGEIEKYNPEILECCKKSINNKSSDLDFQRLDKNLFEKCPNISIDYAVMEKTKKGIVLPMDVGWSDIGNWQSVWENSKKDNEGNAIEGNVIVEDSKNCLFKSENRLVVGVGLENLIIVDTSDVLLVSCKDEAQKIKEVVKKLNSAGMKEGQEHKKIYRPWGSYISVLEETKWKVKMIMVKPGESLSLQMHHHRAEHWVVVEGIAKIDLNSEQKILLENESTYIPIGSKHRLSNPGKIPLILIEIQTGNYLDENDIVRFDDKYGRLKN